MMIVGLSVGEQVTLIFKASLSIPCRICLAEERQTCHDTYSPDELFLALNGQLAPIHLQRYHDAAPLYEAAAVVAKEELRQKIKAESQARHQKNPTRRSDFYEAPGDEINVECDYCGVEAGDTCITHSGLLTKSHRLRVLKHKRMGKGK